jgi:hypothetical protein
MNGEGLPLKTRAMLVIKRELRPFVDESKLNKAVLAVELALGLREFSLNFFARDEIREAVPESIIIRQAAQNLMIGVIPNVCTARKFRASPPTDEEYPPSEGRGTRLEVSILGVTAFRSKEIEDNT